ncbi:MAG: ArsR family transcriptional regulator [bacterium]|nr:ArsR family transcriptional regulator [bacterium]
MNPNASEAVVELRELVAADQLGDADALEALFADIGEDIIEAVRAGNREGLAALRREVRRAYSLLVVRQAEGAEETPAFVLGRIAALVELAGAAARSQLPAGFGRELDDDRNLEILKLLQDQEMALVELTKHLGIDKAAVSRRLQRLDAAGLIIRQMSGRCLYSRLTPAARQVVESKTAAAVRGGYGFDHFENHDIAAMFRKAGSSG